MGTRNRAVVSVIGRDQKGVVARISTYLAERKINIEDTEQRVMEGLFIMTMLVDLSDLDTSLDEMIMGLKTMGEEIHMDVSVRLHSTPERKRVAILVTKEAHCLDKLIEDSEAGTLNGEIVVILSNHDTLQPVAARHQLPMFTMPSSDKAQHETFLVEKLAEYAPDLIVLARYMQVLTPQVLSKYPSRIINIHPSLLPYHPGPNAYRQAWEAGVRVSGCTAHFVTEQLDAGPVVLQDVFHIEVGVDTLDEVRRRGQALEAKVLARAVHLYLNDQLVVKDGKVIFRPGHFLSATERERSG
jgi:formyltetrahydrofolate deformylase